MHRAEAVAAAAYEGVDAPTLAERLGVPRLVLFDVVPSTMDVAHGLAAEGAPGGCVVLADMQVAGRGRHGKRWASEAGQGIWLTMIDRPRDPAAVEVLSLRAGLAIADALEPLADEPLRLKWPNDVFASGGKLAGILVEARWRDNRLDWVAVGVGVNVRAPQEVGGGRLRPGTSRLEALVRIVPALRAGLQAGGGLTRDELARYAQRDLAVGRPVVSPAAGTVEGIDASGAILITGSHGTSPYRSGSLVFRTEAGAA